MEAAFHFIMWLFLFGMIATLGLFLVNLAFNVLFMLFVVIVAGIAAFVDKVRGV